MTKRKAMKRRKRGSHRLQQWPTNRGWKSRSPPHLPRPLRTATTRTTQRTNWKLSTRHWSLVWRQKSWMVRGAVPEVWICASAVNARGLAAIFVLDLPGKWTSVEFAEGTAHHALVRFTTGRRHRCPFVPSLAVEATRCPVQYVVTEYQDKNRTSSCVTQLSVRLRKSSSATLTAAQQSGQWMNGVHAQ